MFFLWVRTNNYVNTKMSFLVICTMRLNDLVRKVYKVCFEASPKHPRLAWQHWQGLHGNAAKACLASMRSFVRFAQFCICVIGFVDGAKRGALIRSTFDAELSVSYAARTRNDGTDGNNESKRRKKRDRRAERLNQTTPYGKLLVDI